MANPSLQADPNYRHSIHRFPCDGSRHTWDINFSGGYISREHVKARLERPNAAPETVSLTWVAPNTIRVIPTPPYGAELIVYRDTPKDLPVADFSDGAPINEKNLDDNAKQAVFIAAEALDRGEGALADITPRAVLVPAGQVAPPLNLNLFRGAYLGVDMDGNFTPIRGGVGGQIIDIGSGMVMHEGQTLSSILSQRIVEIELTTVELEQLAYTVTDQGNAAIQQALATTTLDNALSTLRSDHESLSGVVADLELIADQNTEGLFTTIQQHKSERIAADTAMAATIALIGAKNGTSNAFIVNLDTLKVSATESFAQRLTTINTEVANNKALIQSETENRVSALEAEATQRNSLGTTLRGEISAAIAEEATARSTADAAEAAQRTTLAATLRQETSDGLAAEGLARRDAITAAITTEQQARASAIAAEATQRNNLAATLRSETTALIQTEQQARATAISAEATARTTMGSTLQGNINSQIQTEATTRANADAVFTQNFTLLGARRPDGSAFVLDESKVLLTGGNSMAYRLNGIDTAVNNAVSRIANEETARANAVSALASRTSTLESTVGSHSASINSQATVNADLYGRTEARFVTTAVAGNGRAQLAIYANGNGGGGVDIVGDVRISGDLMVEGSITSAALAPNTATQHSIQTGWGIGPAASELRYSPAVTLTTTGGPVRIDVTCNVVFGANGGPQPQTTTVVLALLRSINGGPETMIGPSQTLKNSESFRTYLSWFVLDVPPAGSTVSYRIQTSRDSGTYSCLISQGQLLAVEFKK